MIFRNFWQKNTDDSHMNSSEKERMANGQKDSSQAWRDKRDREPGDSGKRQEWLLANLGRFQHLQASEIMIARASICAIPVDASWQEVLEIMTKNPHSRYPVYTQDIDDTRGFVHVKDVFMHMATFSDHGEEGHKNFSLQRFIRSVLFVSPSMMIDDLLFDMKSSKTRMAMVVDEYGGVDGLVTIEDVLEEIVGDIQDEYDSDELTLTIEKNGFVETDARVEIVDLEERYGVMVGEKMREEDFHTLGGLMFLLAGRVPAAHEVIEDEETGIHFHILESDSRRIKRVKFRLMDLKPLPIDQKE